MLSIDVYRAAILYPVAEGKSQRALACALELSKTTPERQMLLSSGQNLRPSWALLNLLNAELS